MSAHCRSCSAPIIWAATERAKRMPVDADPVPDGTIRLRPFEGSETPTAHVTTEPEREQLRAEAAARGEELLLHKSHFATCPNADRHRSAA